MPADLRPMLATRGDHVPVGPEWTHEVKWDGMRVRAHVDEGAVRLFSRNDNDVTVSFPELQGIPGAGLVLDAEVVAFADGLPTFGALADRMHVRNARRAQVLSTTNPVTLLVFDVLQERGRDLTRLPLAERRAVLAGLDLQADRWQTPPAYDDGAMLFEATRQQGLEGIVSKRLASRYEPGLRSRHWLKFPHRARTSWVVGGWRPETGSATRLGALLVGEPTADGLLYRGRVGSGIAGKVGPMLREALTAHARDDSPFSDVVPRLDALGTHWVEPVLVVDVESLGFTPERRLRQPSYRGVRPDLGPQDLM